MQTLQVEELVEEGVKVGPAPRSIPVEEGAAVGTHPVYQVAQDFYQDPPALYPEEPWVVRGGQEAPTLVFQAFRYDHGARELRFLRRIRVRVDLAESPVGKATLGLSLATDPGLSSLPAGPVFRLRTSEPGIYRLTGADLVAAGADPAGVDPRNISLYRGGVPVALQISGEADGVFDPGDSLQFYSWDPGDRHFAGDGFFLLYGSSPGARWSIRPSEASTAPVIPWFRHVEEQVYREYYFGPIPGGMDMDHWVGGFGRWAYTGSPPTSLPISVTDPAPSGAGGQVTVHLASSVETGLDPDHHHRLFFDGTQLSDEIWSGRGFRDADGYVPAGLLTAGTHQIGLQATLDRLPAGIRFDFLMPWGVRLEYDRLPVASADSAGFTTSTSSARFQVSGFSTPDVVALDVSNPHSLVEITGVQVSGAGPYQAEFGHQDSAGRKFQLFASGAVQTPTGIRSVRRVSLRDSARRAGWIAICPEGWESSLDPLKTRRLAEGLEPLVLSIQDVVDEFSGGVMHPEAIQRLLAYAHANWARAPEYLLLAGDSNANPRAYPGGWFTSDTNFLPVPLRTAGRELLRNETPADAWFGRLTGNDDVPEVAVGRVHARSAAELLAVSTKIAGYDSAASGVWSRQLLSVSDDGEPFFQTNAERAIDLSLPGLSVQHLNLTSFTSSVDLATTLRTGIEAGALLVQFVGHGSPQIWTDADVLPVATVTGFSNGSLLPVVISMTCEDGYFGDVFSATRCLAEEMVMNPNGGAVAYLASGARTTSEAKDLYHRAVMEALFRKDKRRLGDALREAAQVYLANSSDGDNLLDGFNLFGDPATQVRIPNPLIPGSFTVTRLLDGSIRLSWAPVNDPNLSGYQIYRRIGTGDSVLVATTSETFWDDTSEVGVSGLQAGRTALAATAARYYSVRAMTLDGLGSALHAEIAAAPLTVAPAVIPGGGGGGGGCNGRGTGDPLVASLFWLIPLCYGLRRRVPRAGGPAPRAS